MKEKILEISQRLLEQARLFNKVYEEMSIACDEITEEQSNEFSKDDVMIAMQHDLEIEFDKISEYEKL